MYAPHRPPLPGSLLGWGGLLTLALALMGGLLGMHVIGSAQAASMTSHHVSSTGATASTAAEASVAVAPASAYPASTSSTLPPAGYAEGWAATGHQKSSEVCGCSSSGCDTSMAHHGACIPVAGSATLAAPPPGLVRDPAAGPTPVAPATSNSADLRSTTPSLIQLSISRT